MKVLLLKTQLGLIPENSATSEWFDKIKPGQVVRGDFKKVRNYAFHRKFFALLNLAYEYWTPGEIDTKWGKPQKHFDTFRKNVTVLAGWGEPVFNIDGTFKMQPKSISFASMDNEEFQALYNAVLDVLMKRILTGMDREEVERLTERFLEFA